MAEQKQLNLINVRFSESIICDGCKQKLIPRKDTVFRDSNYGITYCLKCRSDYLKSQIQIK